MEKDKGYPKLLKIYFTQYLNKWNLRYSFIIFGCVWIAALKLVGLGALSSLDHERKGVWWLFHPG